MAEERDISYKALEELRNGYVRKGAEEPLTAGTLFDMICKLNELSLAERHDDPSKKTREELLDDIARYALSDKELETLVNSLDSKQQDLIQTASTRITIDSILENLKYALKERERLKRFRSEYDSKNKSSGGEER